MIAQSTNRPTYILPIIIFVQFAGTSLWLAGNAIMPEIIQILNLETSFMGYVSLAVQAGFIFLTLYIRNFHINRFGLSSKVIFY